MSQNGERRADQMPHDQDAEEAVISALLCDGEGMRLVRTILSPADFYSGRHRAAFEAALSIHNEGADIETIGLRVKMEAMGVAGAHEYVVRYSMSCRPPQTSRTTPVLCAKWRAAGIS